MSGYRVLEPEMSDATREAFLALVEQAMMSGFLALSAKRDEIESSLLGRDQTAPAGDILRDALADYPSGFLGMRADLLRDVIEAIS